MNLNKIMKWIAFGVGAIGLLLGMIFYTLGNLEAAYWSLFICIFGSTGGITTLELK